MSAVQDWLASATPSQDGLSAALQETSEAQGLAEGAKTLARGALEGSLNAAATKYVANELQRNPDLRRELGDKVVELPVAGRAISSRSIHATFRLAVACAPGSLDEAPPKLLRRQLELLGMLGRTTVSKRALARAVSKLKLADPARRSAYVDAIKDLGDSDLASLAGYGVSSVALAMDPEESTLLVDRLLAPLVKTILESRGAPPSELLEVAAPLLHKTSPEFFHETMQPKIASALNLRAEEKLGAVAALFEHTPNVDLSPYADDLFLMAPICKAVTSSNDAARNVAISAVAALTPLCKSSAVALAVLSSLGATLDGTGPLGKTAVAQSFQRAAVLSAIDVFAQSVSDGGVTDADEAAQVADFACGQLAAYVKTEKTPALLGQALIAGAHWIQASQAATANADFVSVLVKGVLQAAPVAREHVRALSLLLASASTSVREQVAEAVLATKNSSRPYDVCVLDDASSSSSGAVTDASSADTSASKKAKAAGASSSAAGSSAAAAKKKKKKGGDLDALEAEMLAMGAKGSKKKKSAAASSGAGKSANKSSAASVASGPGASSSGAGSVGSAKNGNGVVGALFDTLLVGDNLSSGALFFKQHHAILIHALSATLLLATVDAKVAAIIAELESSTGFKPWSLLAAEKKVWSSLVAKSARQANVSWTPRTSVVIAGINDDADENLAPDAQIPSYLSASEWASSVVGLNAGAETQLVLARLLRSVLTDSADRFGPSEGKLSIPALTLASLALSPHFKVRRVARTVAGDAFASLNGKSALRAAMAGLQVYLSRVPSSATLESSRLKAYIVHVLQASVKDSDAAPSSEALIELIIVCHHPAARSLRIWHRVRKLYAEHLGTGPERHMLRDEGLRAAVQTQLVEDLCLSSPKNTNKAVIEAARSAVAQLLAHAEKGVASIPGLVPAITSALDASTVGAFSSQDCIVAAAPSGTLSEVGVAALEAATSAKDKKGSSAGGAKSGAAGKQKMDTRYMTEDEIWEMQVREELEAKKKAAEQGAAGAGAQGAATSLEDRFDEKLIARELQAETELRERMVPVAAAARQALDLLAALCRDVSAAVVHRDMNVFANACFPISNAPLVLDDMQDVLSALLSTGPNEAVQRNSDFLALALQMALREDTRPGCLVHLGEACRILFTEACGLAEDGHHQPLTAGLLDLLFPVMRFTIVGLALDPEILVLWATFVVSGEDEDDDADDDDDDEKAEEKEKKPKSKKKKDKDGKDKDGKDKKKKDKKKTKASKNEPEAPENGNGPESEPAAAVKPTKRSNPYEGYMDFMEAPVDSVERAVGLINLHANTLAAVDVLRLQSMRALLRACLVLPGAMPSPADVMSRLCSAPPPLMDTDLFELVISEDGLLSESPEVRRATLGALLAAAKSPQGLSSRAHASLVARIWLVAVDDDEEARGLARELVEQTQARFPVTYLEPYVALLSHEYAHVRRQASKSIAAGIEEHPDTGEKAIEALVSLYTEKLRLAQEEDNEASSKPKFIDRDAEAKKLAKQEKRRRPRQGVATTLLACADSDGEGGVLSADQAKSAFAFICDQGLRDNDGLVRQTFLESGMQLVSTYGKHMIDQLLPMLEPYLREDKASGKGSKQKSGEAEMDWQREGAVILVGSLASFLDKTDERIPRIAESLVEALRTPNEAVQLAATKCLPPLMKAAKVKERGAEYVDLLMLRATLVAPAPEKEAGAEGEDEDDEDEGPAFILDTEAAAKSSYAERRGAALGVGSVVKGLGITVLKKNNVVPRIEAACKSTHTEVRQGGLMVLEALCSSLGMLFEPYVIGVLPSLLQCFADAKKPVRNAAQDASRAIMARLSGHGVKLILPTLLKAIDDPAWRTKQAAIRMLGSMAFCARKQLAAALPQVVPTLVSSLTDTHAKVRAAGSKALKDIGSVIQNPEIQALVPTLKRALTHPDTKTAPCVDALHRTRFVHMVDAPSLALIVPVLDRGLNERSAETKKKAALITGNMCSMISDVKAVLPYVEDLMPVLRKVLVDPIPGVRSTAAKALGTLTSGLGEGLPDFANLLQWLLETSRSDTSPVERSGGAQGLVEVIVALGDEFMLRVLNENVFPMAYANAPPVREGVVWVMVFLPPVLGVKKNEQFVTRELPIVVNGLADESEFVRDVSMRAGQVIVEQHAIEHTHMLLPVLEEGLEDEKWRVRQSSVHLLGDLLYRVGGSAEAVAAARQAREAFQEADDEDDADMTDSEDEEETKGSAQGGAQGGKHALRRATAVVDANFDAALGKALGEEKRKDVLASVYLMRTDRSAVVRQSALKVWKNLVVNTGRALKEILKPLMDKIVAGLSGESDDKRMAAGRSLGDIVRKLGERVLPDIIPIIQDGFKSDDADTRAGIALGLLAVIEAASRKQLEGFVPRLLPAVQSGLSDEDEDVQEAAAEAFGALYRQVGSVAMNEIVPNMLTSLEASGLDNEEGERALEGLTKILALRSREIMPLLLPKLLVSPMTPFHAKALGAVCETISPVLHFYVDKIQGFCLRELVKGAGGPGGAHEEDMTHVWDATCSMLQSIEEERVAWLVPGLLNVLVESKSTEEKRVVVAMLGTFCATTEADFSDHLAAILKELIKRFSSMEEDKVLLTESWKAFSSVIKATPQDTLLGQLDFIRSMLKSVASDAKYRLKDRNEAANYVLPGLCLPKGLEPLLPLYQHALMNGSAEQRESAALGLGELVDLTSPAALRPFVIKITGPLIRIVGDRFPWQVKVAILQTLSKLLDKGGPLLRPFLPQLQTTFVKALNSEHTRVRDNGTAALKKLIKIGTRVDPLVNDLGNTAVAPETDSGVRLSVLEALSGVLLISGAKATQPVLGKCAGKMESENLLFNRHAAIRKQSSICLARVLKHVEQGAQAFEVAVRKRVDSLREDAAPSAGSWASVHTPCLLVGAAASSCTDLLLGSENAPGWFKDIVEETWAHGVSLDNPTLREEALNACGAWLASVGADTAPKVTDSLVERLLSGLKDKLMDVRIGAMQALKRASRLNPELMKAYGSRVAPDIFAATKEPKLRVAADQALLAVTQVRSDPEVLKAVIKGISSAAVGRSLGEYCRKTLAGVDEDTVEEAF
ncbi:eIF-2-alpha kinase activator GCN1 [Hondaea fermentalgiana]|uniref:eIF-2-alpha kinase activator GCN1 n=1 Tax=Hondaea fermentalgiana TaxID=2315210 RepID=A0A2R5GI77_9STRA|nr:eIF-2-alpha kinase activator GCN1 [Hondaea fermentalgiana]|eukprot:GBG27991.1 eIF-2-alpha kinase activator GCN1 [Hondaea fermentalgiana]